MGWFHRLHYLRENVASAAAGASVSVSKLWETASLPYWPKLAASISLEWMTLSAGTAAAAWLLWRPQSPGYAMGVLAVMAMLATFFSKPTQVQRTLVILLATGLFWLETSAIERDHARAQAATAETLRQMLLEHDRATEKPSAYHGYKSQSNIDANGTKTKLVSNHEQRQFEKWPRQFSGPLAHGTRQGGDHNELAFLSSDGSFDRPGESSGDKDLLDGLSEDLPGVTTDGGSPAGFPIGSSPNAPFYNVAPPLPGSPPGLPEPSMWTEVFLGLGAVGVTLRRRRPRLMMPSATRRG